MANIRSERQAMDRLPGKPLPRYEVIDAAYAEVPEGGKVNLTTGEIKEEKPVDAEFKEVPPDPTPEPTESQPAVVAEKSSSEPPTGRLDMPWLIEAVNKLKWDILQYIKETYKVDTSGNLGDVVDRLSDKQIRELSKEVQDRLDMK